VLIFASQDHPPTHFSAKKISFTVISFYFFGLHPLSFSLGYKIHSTILRFPLSCIYHHMHNPLPLAEGFVGTGYVDVYIIIYGKGKILRDNKGKWYLVHVVAVTWREASP